MTLFWQAFIAGVAFLAGCEALVLLATISFFARLDRRSEEQRVD